MGSCGDPEWAPTHKSDVRIQSPSRGVTPGMRSQSPCRVVKASLSDKRVTNREREKASRSPVALARK